MLEEQCIVGTRKGLENCHQLHVITCQHVIPKLYYLLSFLWNIKEDFEKYLSALVVHTMEMQCNGVWLPTFFKICSFVVCERKSV